MSQFEDRVVTDAVIHPKMNRKSYLSSNTKVTLDKDKNPRNPRFLLKSLSNKQTEEIQKFKVIEAFVMFILITFST